MPDIIKLLPDAVANQIAAGEVVQRPASAVKELIENAIDADATAIKVIVKNSGKTLVQVIDNGKGMSETDARMALERHATSKISKAEDLFEIHTKGFRGEAIASIAAVSQMEIKTKRAEDDMGTQITVEGSKFIDQTQTVTTDGTSISVKNLFYNIPARRTFLKSDPVEMRHISEEFQRVALAHPEVSLELYHNDLPIFTLKEGKLSQRIVGLFGKNYKEQLAKCDEETPLLNVWGYIGKPQHAKKTRGEQYFFVNRRFIKSPYLNHAVTSAFAGLITKDAFPFYVLNIDIEPQKIDINVHPTKTEIKFEDEKLVYGVVQAAIKKALGVHSFSPSIDFEMDVNMDLNSIAPRPSEGNGDSSSTSFKKPSTEGWEKMFEEHPGNRPQEEEQNTITFKSKMHDDASEGANDFNTEREKTAIQVLQSYIITQVKSGLIVIDQKVAHERILFEKYFNLMDTRFGASQQFLFPQTIELNPIDFDLVMELEEEIKALGFVFNHFGKNTIVVNGIPSDIPVGTEKEVFEGLIEQYKQNKTAMKLDTKENLARALAKRSAMNHNYKLSSEEMNVLIDQLFACKTPEFSPDGAKTMVILEQNRIEELFK